MLPVESPFKVYTGLDGKPLDNGYVYFGVANQNPITSPVTVYWDAAGTQPAAQPLRTVNGYIMRAGTPANVFYSGAYSELVQDSRSRQVFYARTSADFSIVSTVLSFITNLAASGGSALIGFIQDGIGAVLRTVQDELRDTVSVKQFGAIGINNPANEAADTAAFTAALATGKSVKVPPGVYYVNSTMFIAANQSLYGTGRGRCFIYYTGSTYAVQMGVPGISGNTNVELRDLFIACTNKVTPVIAGVAVLNCFYPTIRGLDIAGAFSPNLAEPLQGWGLYVTSNSIIGRATQVSVRQWEYGYYLRTLTTGASYWTAAWQFDGQGEIASNMYGIVVGDPTTALVSGVGVSFSKLSVQGNYSGGALLNTGDGVVFDTVYFEGNANNNIKMGTALGAPEPYGTKIINCTMATDGLPDVDNPYVYTPYDSHISITKGIGTKISGNSLVYSDTTPLIRIAAGVRETTISENRLSNASIPGARCVNSGTSTVFENNWPEYPNQGTVKVGTFTRTLSDADGLVSISGVGFKPSSIEFFAAIDTVNENSFGVADALSARSISRDAVGAQLSTIYAIYLIRPTAADVARASIASFDADGFTLVWTHTGAPPGNNLVINYRAYR